MLKKFLLAIIFINLFLFLNHNKIFAAENPLAVPNNSFGIHILDENDLNDAASLVNSGSGDWGYITLVIRKDERDTKRWQNAFDEMRRLHLIPIVRVASIQSDAGWEKPNFDEIDGWISFLNSLNWVIKNRYMIIGNEPNHAKEWGGEVNPEEYAEYLKTFSEKLKAKSTDFFVLNAGFDASSANTKESMSENVFVKRMVQRDPDIFNYIDGWTSHSYPNPNFSGTQDDKGRGTVKTFDWELSLLKNLGVNKEFPVFITETGWAHNGATENKEYADINKVTDRLKAAFEIAWKDERIVAVTPFILNYQSEPFDVFSWKKKDGIFYDFYYEVQKLPKIAGSPIQTTSVDVVSVIFPPIIPSEGRLTGVVVIKNKGQQIWEGNEIIYAQNWGHEVTLEPVANSSNIEPEEKTLAVMKVKIGKN